MGILDIIDCNGCESYEFHPGRIWGDPDQCYPDEAVCKEGAPDDGPCGRMLGALRGMINDGGLKTEHGGFYAKEFLQDEQKEEGVPQQYREFDFSSAYFWVPDNFDVGNIKPYKDEKEVFYDWFI